MNKKLVSVLVSAATLLSGTAFADFDPQFYVGAEAQATHLHFKNKKNTLKLVKKAWWGGGAFLGSRFNENLGVELGYALIGKKTATNAQNTFRASSKRKNAYFDIMGYLPIDCAMDLIASVGAGHTTVHKKSKFWQGNTSCQNKDYSTKVRVGVGAQYKVTDNIGARLMLNYQPIKGEVKYLTSARLGMFYQF